MIIYGSRFYGRGNKVVTHEECSHCAVFGPKASYDARRWGHLYFIPLFPTEGRKRLLQMCPSCERGTTLPIDQVPSVQENVGRELRACLQAVDAGLLEFQQEVGAAPVRCSTYLFGSVAFIAALGLADSVEEIRRIVPALPEADRAMVEGKLAEISGQPAMAIASYQRATVSGVVELWMLVVLGRAQLRGGHTEEALATFLLAEELDVLDLAVKQGLIDVHLARQDWNRAADAYEAAFLIDPSLKDSKPRVKAYKKVCKKAKRAPQN